MYEKVQGFDYGHESLPRRFWDHTEVDESSGCWVRSKGLSRQGYSRFQQKKVSMLAHRITLTMSKGPSPYGKPHALHSCDNPPCVNPEHLRWGSNAENKRDVADRGSSPHLKKTHCPWGHPYSGTNLKVYQGRRFCRTCGKDRSRRFYLKSKEG